MTFPNAGMNMAPPAIVKKLSHAIAVPDIVIGKTSLIQEKTTIPKLAKKPIKKRMKPYQKGLWILITPTKQKRLSV